MAMLRGWMLLTVLLFTVSRVGARWPAGPPTTPAMRTVIEVLLSLAGALGGFGWLVPRSGRRTSA